MADSTELNGCFKMGVTEAKKAIFAARIDKRFTPEDIIPIINAAWAKSFGRPAHGKKAAVVRGWNPCNWALLRDPDILATKAAGDTEPHDEPSAGETSCETDVPTAINISAGKSLELTDTLLDHADNEASRKRRFDNGMKRVEVMTTWKMSKKITSGTLAARRQYRLGVTVKDDVFALVQDKLAKEGKKNTDAKERRRNFMAKVASAKETMARNDTLSGKEMTIMIQYKKPPNGSAVKKRKDDLVAQWNRRQNNPSPPQSPSNRMTNMVEDPVESGDEMEEIDGGLDGLNDSMSRAEI
jgi:hypothetical protein